MSADDLARDIQVPELEALGPRQETFLAAMLEYDGASWNDVERALYNLVLGKPSGKPFRDHPEVHAGNVREVARKYFEDREKPQVDHLDIEATGTDLDDLLADGGRVEARQPGQYPPQAVLAAVRDAYDDDPVRAEDLRRLFDEPDLDRLTEALEDLYLRGELLKAEHLGCETDEGYVPTDSYSV